MGASATDPDNLKFLYEGHEQFTALPSYGVIPALDSMTSDSSLLNNALKEYSIEFNPAKLVHGEQYLQLFRPIPISGALRSQTRVVDVLDKGSGALVILECETFDADTGAKICYNQSSLFLVGAGKFGGKKMSDKSEAKAVVDPPNRAPDIIVIEKTSSDQVCICNPECMILF